MLIKLGHSASRCHLFHLLMGFLICQVCELDIVIDQRVAKGKVVQVVFQFVDNSSSKFVRELLRNLLSFEFVHQELLRFLKNERQELALSLMGKLFDHTAHEVVRTEARLHHVVGQDAPHVAAIVLGDGARHQILVEVSDMITAQHDTTVAVVA